MTRSRIIIALAAAGSLAGSAALLHPGAGEAQESRTIVLKTPKQGAVTVEDLGPRKADDFRFELGDRIHQAQPIVENGKPVGSLDAIITFTSAKTTDFPKATASVTATVRLRDGVMYAVGSFTRGRATGVIVGGSGAYAGAAGTLEAGEKSSTITLKG